MRRIYIILFALALFFFGEGMVLSENIFVETHIAGDTFVFTEVKDKNTKIHILYSQSVPTFYFYSSESSINSFVTIKLDFDIYFDILEGYFFQPFDLKVNFENEIFNPRKGNIYLLTKWHFDELVRRNVPLIAAMQAISKGGTTQKKLLIAGNEVTDIELLRNRVVASAGSEEHGRIVLKQMLGKDYASLLKTIKILVVPKDIDALLSLDYRVAAAAISTESGMDRLAELNPELITTTHTLAYGNQEPILIAATIGPPNKLELKMLKGLLKMQDTEKGLNILKKLKLEGWKKLE